MTHYKYIRLPPQVFLKINQRGAGKGQMFWGSVFFFLWEETEAVASDLHKTVFGKNIKHYKSVTLIEKLVLLYINIIFFII